MKPYLQSFRRAVEHFENNNSLCLLEVPDDRYVIFRIDGVIAEVSFLVFKMLGSLAYLPAEERLCHLEREFGSANVKDAIAAIAELDQQFLEAAAVPLEEPDVSRAQPAGILLMMTQACNLACTYCYAGDGSYGSNQKVMPLTDALKAVDLMLERAPKRKSFTIVFFGGEPLLNFNGIRQVVAYCEEQESKRDLHFRYSMTTNGTILDDEIVAFLKEKSFELMVSFDGPGQGSRPFADGRSSAERVRASLRRLADAGVHYQIRATLTPEMYCDKTVDELIRVGQSVEREVIFSPVSPKKNQKFADDIEPEANRDNYDWFQNACRKSTERSLASATGGEKQQTFVDGNRRLIRAFLEGKARGFGRCGVCAGMVAASTDGRLYPCHRFAGMESYAVGDIENGVDTNETSRFFKSVDDANEGLCEDCFAQQICCGFCAYGRADGEGGFVTPDADACEALRNRLKYSISVLLRLQDLPPENRGAFFGFVQAENNRPEEDMQR